MLLDSDGDPVCELGPELKTRSETVITVPTVVALAEPSFEAWFVASAETMPIAGLDPSSGVSPETQVRNALHPLAYAKPTWQPRLAKAIDLDLARPRDATLQRLIDRFEELLVAVGFGFPA